MSSLKEKAKTLEEWVKTVAPLYHIQYGHISEERIKASKLTLVRLSDAEQEIEKIKGLAEETSNIMIKTERLELKQKLQFLWNTIPLDFNLDTGEVSLIGTKKQWRDWLKKFEGLLKEDEAKP